MPPEGYYKRKREELEKYLAQLSVEVGIEWIPKNIQRVELEYLGIVYLNLN